MRSSFASRRPKARKIEADEEEEVVEVNKQLDSSEQSTPPSRIKPTKKKRATLRLSFGPEAEAASSERAETDDEPIIALKKSALSRKAIERNAARKAGLAGGVVGMDQLNSTPVAERQSYSKEYLEELKSSTPTKPAEVEEEGEMVVGNGGDDYDMVLDDDVMAVVEAGNQRAVARLGDVAPVGTTGIIDEGLVQVLKARRAERATRAKAGDFISLDGDDDLDDGDDEILLKSKKKKSRLRGLDDGGFDDDDMEKYIEDERIVLGGKSAQREQERRRREGIRDTINQAEGINSDDDVDSDFSKDSLAEEWERDQIRKGAFSSNASGSVASDLEMLTRQPPNVIPLPNLKHALARLEESLAAMELKKAQTVKQVEILQHEKREIAQRENMVQDRLKKAGEEYEKLRGELSMGGGGPEGVVSRGLESFGNTPIRVVEDS